MRRKSIAVPVIALLAIVVTIPLLFSGSSVRAATEPQIEEAIVEGLAWLADHQDGTDGYFERENHTLGNRNAATCLALLKFEERGWELFPPPGDGPFDSDYDYDDTVALGLDYVFKQMTLDGSYVYVGSGDPGTTGRVYETGICMMAVAGTRTPGTIVTAASSQVSGKTYAEVLQGMLNWMEHAQNVSTDPGPPAQCCWGGWGYTVNDCSQCDNSNSGYAALGIGFAMSPTYNFALQVTPSVLTELDTYFINNIQDYPPGTGCSDYRPCYSSYYTGWYNLLKTGNLLHEMALVGRVGPTVDAAMGCIETNWNAGVYQYGDTSYLSGWHGPVPEPNGPDTGYYQAMFTIMKGLESYKIGMLGTIAWFGDLSDFIYAHKETGDPVGWYWTGTGHGKGDWVMETSWALLTLEKVVPEIEPGPPVGGITWPAPDSGVVAAPADTSGRDYTAAIAGAAAAALAVIAASGWYARRRWIR